MDKKSCPDITSTPSFSETPTPTDLQSTMAACRLNLNALLTYMVGKHGLDHETATRFIGRNTVRVIRDFRQEAQVGSAAMNSDFQTQPIPLVNRIDSQMRRMGEKMGIDDGEIEIHFVNEDDDAFKEGQNPAIETRFIEVGKVDTRKMIETEKDAFDVEAFFSDPDPERTPIRDTRILQMIEEEMAVGANTGKDAIGKYEELFAEDKMTPLIPQQQPRKTDGPMILPPLKIRNSGPVKRTREAAFLTPTPASVMESSSLTTAILHFTEANSQYRMTPDGRIEQTEKLELDFSDLL